MSNVNIGDLAICIAGGRHTGKIVTVLRPWRPGELIGGFKFRNWEPGVWVCALQRPVDFLGAAMMEGPFADHMLRPVSGLPGMADARRLERQS